MPASYAGTASLLKYSVLLTGTASEPVLSLSKDAVIAIFAMRLEPLRHSFRYAAAYSAGKECLTPPEQAHTGEYRRSRTVESPIASLADACPP